MRRAKWSETIMFTIHMLPDAQWFHVFVYIALFRIPSPVYTCASTQTINTRKERQRTKKYCCDGFKWWNPTIKCDRNWLTFDAPHMSTYSNKPRIKKNYKLWIINFWNNVRVNCSYQAIQIFIQFGKNGIHLLFSISFWVYQMYWCHQSNPILLRMFK